MIATNPSAFLSAFSFDSLGHSWFAQKVIPLKTDKGEPQQTPTGELENRCSIQLSYGSNRKSIPVIPAYLHRVDDFPKSLSAFLSAFSFVTGDKVGILRGKI
jgi:hypothetical protein